MKDYREWGWGGGGNEVIGQDDICPKRQNPKDKTEERRLKRQEISKWNRHKRMREEMLCSSCSFCSSLCTFPQWSWWEEDPCLYHTSVTTPPPPPSPPQSKTSFSGDAPIEMTFLLEKSVLAVWWLTDVCDDTLHSLQQLLDRHLVLSQPAQHLRVWGASTRLIPRCLRCHASCRHLALPLPLPL